MGLFLQAALVAPIEGEVLQGPNTIMTSAQNVRL